MIDRLGCVVRIISYSALFSFVYIEQFGDGLYTCDWNIDWCEEDLLKLTDDCDSCHCIAEQLYCERLEK